VLIGHTDAVWQLVISGQKLLSCSADGSVRLWDSNLTEPLQSTFTSNYSSSFISVFIVII
jgi:striatin 1/3/4